MFIQVDEGWNGGQEYDYEYDKRAMTQEDEYEYHSGYWYIYKGSLYINGYEYEKTK